ARAARRSGRCARGAGTRPAMLAVRVRAQLEAGVPQAVVRVQLEGAVPGWGPAPRGAGGALRERRDDPMARAPITTASYRTGSGGGDTGAPGPLRVTHPA